MKPRVNEEAECQMVALKLSAARQSSAGLLPQKRKTIRQKRACAAKDICLDYVSLKYYVQQPVDRGNGDSPGVAAPSGGDGG